MSRFSVIIKLTPRNNKIFTLFTTNCKIGVLFCDIVNLVLVMLHRIGTRLCHLEHNNMFVWYTRNESNIIFVLCIVHVVYLLSLDSAWRAYQCKQRCNNNMMKIQGHICIHNYTIMWDTSFIFYNYVQGVWSQSLTEEIFLSGSTGDRWLGPKTSMNSNSCRFCTNWVHSPFFHCTCVDFYSHPSL